MASLLSDSLFNSDKGHRHLEAPCYNTPNRRFRSMFGIAPSSLAEEKDAGPRIHTGPPSQLPPQFSRNETVGDYPSMTSIPSAFTSNSLESSQVPNGRGSWTSPSVADRELIRWNVVNEKDAHRGFRMFDGILMSVKDVSSEELFLERMRIAYSAYDEYVASLVNGSPLEIAKGLVRAVSACLTRYFSTQSMLRTNRPFIAKVLNLDHPDMFCSHSDFIQSFLFTNASEEDEAIIALAEKVYAENNFDVCSDFANRREANDTNDSSNVTGGVNVSSTTDNLFDFVTRVAENSVVGGTQPSFAAQQHTGSSFSSDFISLSDELPFQQRKDAADGTTTAMLIMVTDFEALHNYVAYVLYLTPAQLSRRYNVNFDCLRRPRSNGNVECCRARESRKRKRDSAKLAIRTVIEKKRQDKIDTMAERSSTCEAVLQQRSTQTTERNNNVLCHVCLMLFDKCLSTLIDRGFENLNARRSYAVNSAKEIGTATIYTGVIDTVGEVTTNLEGFTFETIAKNADTHEDVTREKGHPQLQFSLPLNNTAGEITNAAKVTRGRRRFGDPMGVDGYEGRQ